MSRINLQLYHLFHETKRVGEVNLSLMCDHEALYAFDQPFATDV